MEIGHLRTTSKLFGIDYHRGYAVLTDWFNEAGIDTMELGNQKYHLGRHTFVNLLRKSGADIVEIKELIGHSDIATTMIYTNMLPEEKDEAMDKLNDLFRKPTRKPVEFTLRKIG